jgi:hypothetical protein
MARAIRQVFLRGFQKRRVPDKHYVRLFSSLFLFVSVSVLTRVAAKGVYL